MCGHIQRKGDWEKAMDAQAKAMGSRGFVTIGNVEAQCLSCGSRELKDPSHPISAENEGSEFITAAAEEIVHIMEPYFQDPYGGIINSEGKERLRTIGKSLYDNGGHEAMLAGFKSTRNIAHRRFGYTGSNSTLEYIWDGIGSWMG